MFSEKPGKPLRRLIVPQKYILLLRWIKHFLALKKVLSREQNICK